jgi:hypothetical protein
MDSWLVGNQKLLIAFKLKEWQPDFFGHQQLSTHIIGNRKIFGCHSTTL